MKYVGKTRYSHLEYSYCIRAIGSGRALFFYDARLKIIMHSCPGCCPAGSIFARSVNESELTRCQVYTERFQKQASSSLFYSCQ